MTPQTEVFRDGDWRLIGRGAYTEIQHHCLQPFGDAPWWFYAYDGVCGVCHEETPIEIMGLRNLCRWDR